MKLKETLFSIYSTNNCIVFSHKKKMKEFNSTNENPSLHPSYGQKILTILLLFVTLLNHTLIIKLNNLSVNSQLCSIIKLFRLNFN